MMRRTGLAAMVIALCWGGPAAAQDRVIIVEESPDVPEPGQVETASDMFRLRLGGLFEGTLGRDQSGNMVSIPRARLRAEALVSTTLEVGVVAEVDISPWSSPQLKEDGPGFVRDVYARISLGNKRVLDLGEARLGFFTMPIMMEQITPQSEMLFLTGSVGREAWLPGRELAAAYEASAYRFNIPVRGMIALGSGVSQRNGLGLLTPPTADDGARGAEHVPLTAGATGAAIADPSLTLRVEGEPLLRWTRNVRMLVGAGAMARPLANGPDARVALAVDGRMEWANFTARTSLLLADTERAPFADSRAFMVEGAMQIIPDFADVRVRYDTAVGPHGWEANRIQLGAAFFYLDGAPIGPLTAAPAPMGGVRFGHSFTLLWLRSYDLMRFSPGRGFTYPSTPDVGNPGSYGPVATSFAQVARWVASGDTDQLVVRVTF